MEIIFYIILVSIITFAYFSRSKRNQPAKTRTATPGILQGAKCVLNETNIHTSKPVALHGRVDQVFKLRDGTHLILDTKVRERIKVYPSDVVQLSVYGLILKYQGYKVCAIALLRFPTGNGKAIYQPVRLYPESKVISLYHRYISILSGSKTATCRCGKHHP
ncbi:MAG: hypothetical protein AB2669_07230 [Candidatus Thiodiazotropha endolucinida]|nr:hypothetical protein [Candidatus Thiodiazotropha taylori]MCW4250337.1 hypothetical protein [Candidatus Thiodiazotropha endolucinida]MCG8061005.1 hypothetical protein [Candidatus Thiodiazotropha taylori]MCG8100837.1 hypothetical protein [Candidatus Thiodiazotropha taylori]MCG8122189.1 hypothetical protein [Candidatus Thiodiazotropha taylori]